MVFFRLRYIFAQKTEKFLTFQANFHNHLEICYQDLIEYFRNNKQFLQALILHEIVVVIKKSYFIFDLYNDSRA